MKNEVAHCESCGKDAPNSNEGYTLCCNELRCYGGLKAPKGSYDGLGNRVDTFKHESNCCKVTR